MRKVKTLPGDDIGGTMIGFMIRRGTYCLEVNGERRCVTIEKPVVLSDEDLMRAMRYVEEESFDELEGLLKSLEGERKVTLDEIIDVTEDLEGDLGSLVDVIDDVIFRKLLEDSEVNALIDDIKRGEGSEEDFKYIIERIVKEMIGRAYEEFMKYDRGFVDELFKALMERD